VNTAASARGGKASGTGKRPRSDASASSNKRRVPAKKTHRGNGQGVVVDLTSPDARRPRVVKGSTASASAASVVVLASSSDSEDDLFAEDGAAESDEKFAHSLLLNMQKEEEDKRCLQEMKDARLAAQLQQGEYGVSSGAAADSGAASRPASALSPPVPAFDPFKPLVTSSHRVLSRT
jgi:hypothetical protein